MLKYCAAAPALLHLTVLIACPALAQQPGTLDQSFGTNGIVRIDFPFDGSGDDRSRDIAVDANGKIVVVGSTDYVISIGPGVDWGTSFAVARLNDDGTPDTTFSSDGFTAVAFDPFSTSSDVAERVLLLDDGSILVAGRVDVITGGFGIGLGVAKLLPDGALDSSFGASGKVMLECPFAGCTTSAIARGPEGSIWLSARSYSWVEYEWFHSLFRLTADGLLDPSFSPQGELIAEGDPSTIASLADGRLLTLGHYQTEPNDCEARLKNSDGSLVDSVLSTESCGADVAVGDGLIVAGGQSDVIGNPPVLTVLGLEPGEEDISVIDASTFSASPAGFGIGQLRAVAALPDGSFVAALQGTSSTGREGWILAKTALVSTKESSYLAFDREFSFDGLMAVEVGDHDDGHPGLRAVAADASGRLLMTGFDHYEDQGADDFLIVRVHGISHLFQDGFESGSTDAWK